MKALNSGAVVLAFPGGDYGVFRPTLAQNVIDFDGCTGYVTTALEAGVPIVPAVSIGGQETQLFITRGHWLAKRLGLKRITLDILPMAVGFPFGLSVFFPANCRCQPRSSIGCWSASTSSLSFGNNPDVHEIDAHVRSLMQIAVERLGRQCRFPVVG